MFVKIVKLRYLSILMLEVKFIKVLRKMTVLLMLHIHGEVWAWGWITGEERFYYSVQELLRHIFCAYEFKKRT